MAALTELFSTYVIFGTEDRGNGWHLSNEQLLTVGDCVWRAGIVGSGAERWRSVPISAGLLRFLYGTPEVCAGVLLYFTPAGGLTVIQHLSTRARILPMHALACISNMLHNRARLHNEYRTLFYMRHVCRLFPSHCQMCSWAPLHPHRAQCPRQKLPARGWLPGPRPLPLTPTPLSRNRRLHQCPSKR